MKRSNINKIFKLGLLTFSVAIIATACVKSVSGRTDFDNLKPTVLFPEGGIGTFSASALLFNPADDTDYVYFQAEYAATSTAPQDEVISIKIDLDALAAYNALGGTQYTVFPDSIFSFTATSVTVKKGNNFSDSVVLTVYPSKINTLDNYLLPISISTAPAGSTIATNHQTLYYHFIGNPIAGLYSRSWVRYNNSQGNPPIYAQTSGVPIPFAPIDGLNVQAESGSAGILYDISFQQVGNVLDSFKVTFDAPSIAASGVSITGGPTIITADPVNGVYKFNYTYDNGVGGLRNITDTYTK